MDTLEAGPGPVGAPASGMSKGHLPEKSTLPKVYEENIEEWRSWKDNFAEFLDNKKIDLVEKQLDIVNNQIIGTDKKLDLLEQQGEAGVQTSKVTKDLLNQVASFTTENKEQQKQLTESKLNIEMAVEKINNIDEEYSELSNPTDTEWRASHKELKEKLWTLEKQITSVHHHVFLQSKHAVQGESKIMIRLYMLKTNLKLIMMKILRSTNVTSVIFCCC